MFKLEAVHLVVFLYFIYRNANVKVIIHSQVNLAYTIFIQIM